jgi:hypothetical protein
MLKLIFLQYCGLKGSVRSYEGGALFSHDLKL